jgi:hypothetical protein
VIPSILHLIWLGHLPRPHADWVERWSELHPGWEIRVWNGQALAGCRHSFEDMRQASNWLRIQILLKYGGVYVDCDVEPLKNIAPLLTGASAAASPFYPRGALNVSNSFMAAEPGHPWIAECARMLESADPSEPFSMGSELVTRALDATGGAKVLDRNDILQHPLWDCRGADIDNRWYAIHHFDGSVWYNAQGNRHERIPPWQ